jgi:DNA-binding response OmpR family regulator
MSLLKDLKNIAEDLNILYVEDDSILLDKTTLLLNNFFQNSLTASDGNEGLAVYKQFYETNNRYIDIVISDIKMPNKNGVELSKEILKINPNQIIIVVSAYSDSNFLIELINSKVHYFLTKPFTSEVLIDILLKSCNELKDVDTLKTIPLKDSFVWDKEHRVLKDGDKVVKLTKNETIIIDLFAKNPNQIFSDEMLFNAIYFDEVEKDMSIDSIKSIIKRLRKKLPAKTIENIYGDGYKLAV